MHSKISLNIIIWEFQISEDSNKQDSDSEDALQLIVLLFGDFSLSKGNSANQAHFWGSKDIHSRGAPLWLHTYSLVSRPGPRNKVTITLQYVPTPRMGLWQA